MGHGEITLRFGQSVAIYKVIVESNWCMATIPILGAYHAHDLRSSCTTGVSGRHLRGPPCPSFFLCVKKLAVGTAPFRQAFRV